MPVADNYRESIYGQIVEWALTEKKKHHQAPVKIKIESPLRDAQEMLKLYTRLPSETIESFLFKVKNAH